MNRGYDPAPAPVGNPLEPAPSATAELRLRRALAVAARAAAPGYGWCYRCGMPWKVTKGHVTHYGGGHGCFPLCEHCWSELTIEERVPFYDRLIRDWHADRPVEGAQAEAIIGAVLAGA